jgi:hypothetical protein
MPGKLVTPPEALAALVTLVVLALIKARRARRSCRSCSSKLRPRSTQVLQADATPFPIKLLAPPVRFLG